MIIEINSTNHIFNENSKIFDEKYYPMMKNWYYIFCIINIVNLFLYVKRIYYFEGILFLLPFINIFSIIIFGIIKRIKVKPNGDKQYIKTYYPNIANKITIDRINTISWIKFIKGKYLDYGVDPIIDDIRERAKLNSSLVIKPFKICIIFWIISIIVLIFI